MVREVTILADQMKKILLTKGKFALVDDDMFEYLNQWKWHVGPRNSYAIRNIKKDDKQKTLYMHREIIFIPKGKVIDHANHNTFDNRRSNLRVSTISQNCANSKIRKETTSKYKGVDICTYKNKGKIYKYFRVRIMIDGKDMYLGLKKTEIEAARLYDQKAIEVFGEFAGVNFWKVK